MKANSASSTSLLIARGILLADATPALRPLLVDESAALTRRLLDAAGPSPWFDLALRHNFLRRVVFAVERLLLPGLLLYWLTRKRLLDAIAHEALEAGCRQIVVLGAGLDTLAWRLQSACACLELDHPASQALKRSAFADGPALVAADLSNASVADALRAQPRFDASQRTLFIAEGLLMYLSPARGALLFSEIASVAAPGSRFAFSFMEARPGCRIGFHNSRHIVDAWLRWRGEPLRWALARTDLNAFAAQHGWELTALSSPEEMRQRFLAPHGLANAPLATGESVALACRAAQ
jgi:methyltransferase (TIGR00027 family)